MTLTSDHDLDHTSDHCHVHDFDHDSDHTSRHDSDHDSEHDPYDNLDMDQVLRNKKIKVIQSKVPSPPHHPAPRTLV